MQIHMHVSVSALLDITYDCVEKELYRQAEAMAKDEVWPNLRAYVFCVCSIVGLLR